MSSGLELYPVFSLPENIKLVYDGRERTTAEAKAYYTAVLLGAGVKISMDGKRRWVDNVFIERLWRSLKYDEVYLKAYESVTEAREGIGDWVAGPRMRCMMEPRRRSRGRRHDRQEST